MFASKDDGVRHRSLWTKKNKHAANYSLTVFVSVPEAVVLFVLVVMGGMGGSFRLPKTITTTATMAAVATKTDPIKMTLNLRDILDQPCTTISGAGIGKVS
jgi:hypothetical protein